MSLKSIELQIAIPKTFDAGKVAEQKNQQSVLSHQHAAAETDGRVRKQRQSVMDSAQSAKLDSRDRGSGRDCGTGSRQEPGEEQPEGAHADHPYKGGFVDFSG